MQNLAIRHFIERGYQVLFNIAGNMITVIAWSPTESEFEDKTKAGLIQTTGSASLN